MVPQRRCGAIAKPFELFRPLGVVIDDDDRIRNNARLGASELRVPLGGHSGTLAQRSALAAIALRRAMLRVDLLVAR
jgi:hypothetical protein